MNGHNNTERHRWSGALVCAAFAFLLSLTGCSEAVHHGLEERSANELIVALGQVQIPASKKLEDGAWTVSVPSALYQEALTTLASRNLPRDETDVLALLESGSGLVPSVDDEQARRTAILTSELEQTFLAMDSVVDAHVHAVLPARRAGSAFDRETPVDPVASVVIVYRSGLLPPSDDAIHAILKGAIERLDSDGISTVLVETTVPEVANTQLVAFGPLVVAQPSVRPLRMMFLGSLFAAALALFGAGMFVRSARRNAGAGGRHEELGGRREEERAAV